MVTKGMTVVRPEMALVSLVDPIVIALVPSASSRTATKGITDIIFLFDGVISVVVTDWITSLTAFITGSRLCGGSHIGMQRSQIAHHLLVLIGLVSVNGLSMLTKIVKTGELFSTMTSERAFTGMFPEGVEVELHCK